MGGLSRATGIHWVVLLCVRVWGAVKTTNLGPGLPGSEYRVAASVPYCLGVSPKLSASEGFGTAWGHD